MHWNSPRVKLFSFHFSLPVLLTGLLPWLATGAWQWPAAAQAGARDLRPAGPLNARPGGGGGGAPRPVLGAAPPGHPPSPAQAEGGRTLHRARLGAGDCCAGERERRWGGGREIVCREESGSTGRGPPDAVLFCYWWRGQYAKREGCHSRCFLIPPIREDPFFFFNGVMPWALRATGGQTAEVGRREEGRRRRPLSGVSEAGAVACVVGPGGDELDGSQVHQARPGALHIFSRDQHGHQNPRPGRLQPRHGHCCRLRAHLGQVPSDWRCRPLLEQVRWSRIPETVATSRALSVHVWPCGLPSLCMRFVRWVALADHDAPPPLPCFAPPHPPPLSLSALITAALGSREHRRSPRFWRDL